MEETWPTSTVCSSLLEQRTVPQALDLIHTMLLTHWCIGLSRVIAPDTLLATSLSSFGKEVERPLCPYSRVQTYVG